MTVTPSRTMTPEEALDAARELAPRLRERAEATEAARQAHQPVVLGAVAQQLYQAMSQRGEGGKDFSAIINSYRKPQ